MVPICFRVSLWSKVVKNRQIRQYSAKMAYFLCEGRKKIFPNSGKGLLFIFSFYGVNWNFLESWIFSIEKHKWFNGPFSFESENPCGVPLNRTFGLILYKTFESSSRLWERRLSRSSATGPLALQGLRLSCAKINWFVEIHVRRY